MTDIQSIRDDVAFMRGLSVSEPHAARKGGVILLTAGTTFAAASLVNWAAATGHAPLAAARWSWWIASGVFYLVLAAAIILIPKSRAVRDRAASAAWLGVGLAIFCIMAGFQVAAWRLHDTTIFAGVPTVILALYGAAWLVAATVTGQGWIRLVSAGSFAASVAIAVLLDGPAVYLAYALALLALAAAPGAALLRPAAGTR
jgi:peptidoglycan/LPS O-acetylase OafA/YrhL